MSRREPPDEHITLGEILEQVKGYNQQNVEIGRTDPRRVATNDQNQATFVRAMRVGYAIDVSDRRTAEVIAAFADWLNQNVAGLMTEFAEQLADGSLTQEYLICQVFSDCMEAAMTQLLQMHGAASNP